MEKILRLRECNRHAGPKVQKPDFVPIDMTLVPER
jgi:hypothetical protein